MNQLPERINKVLARTGIGSRRKIDALIAAQRITVNHKTALIGQKIAPSDLVELDGKAISTQLPKKIILAFHKPKGVTTTKHDPHAKVTVMNFLPKQYKTLFPTGRLDRESRGLLLFTNDGDLALRLEHPRFEHEKEYEIEFVSQQPKTLAQVKADMTKLTQEIVAEASQSKPIHVSRMTFDEQTRKGKATVVLKEGRNRQIRRLFEALGYMVIDLLRTRINTIPLAGIKEGEYVTIDPHSLKL